MQIQNYLELNPVMKVETGRPLKVDHKEDHKQVLNSTKFHNMAHSEALSRGPK